MEILGTYVAPAKLMAIACFVGSWAWMIAIIARHSVLKAFAGVLIYPSLYVYGVLHLTECRWPMVLWIFGLGFLIADKPADPSAFLQSIVKSGG